MACIASYMYSSETDPLTTTKSLTLFSLFHLEGEVECADGEVDGLRIGLPHGAQ